MSSKLRSNKERLDRIKCETTQNVSENGFRRENHTLRINVQPDHDAMNLHNIKLEAPTNVQPDHDLAMSSSYCIDPLLILILRYAWHYLFRLY